MGAQFLRTEASCDWLAQQKRIRSASSSRGRSAAFVDEQRSAYSQTLTLAPAVACPSGSSFLALDAAIEITPFHIVIDQRQERKVSGLIGYEPCGVFS